MAQRRAVSQKYARIHAVCTRTEETTRGMRATRISDGNEGKYDEEKLKIHAMYTEYHSVADICEESDKSHQYLLTHLEAGNVTNKKRTPLLRETNPKYNETYTRREPHYLGRRILSTMRLIAMHAPIRLYDVYHTLRDHAWGSRT